MTGIQLGGGTVSNSNWDVNYLSAKEVSHVDNIRLSEKVWDWVCDSVCGTHRAEAKEYIRQLNALEGKNDPVDRTRKTDIFHKLSKLTSSDYTRVRHDNGEMHFQIGYFKGNPKTHKEIWSWSRPVSNELKGELQTKLAKSLKDRLVESFDNQIKSQLAANQSQTLLGEKKDPLTQAASRLVKPVPVYMAHRYAASELSPPLHAYIMAGEPGSKNAQLFGEKNDMTRSKVELNDAFMAELSKAKYVTRNSNNEKVTLPFELELTQAVERLKEQGQNFAFLDSFVDAIKRELNKVGVEMTLTESHRIGLGYIAAKCNDQQGFYNMDPRKGFTHNEDMRYFEKQKGPVKQQPVKLTTLQEISREQRVYQEYLNEKLGLNGLAQQPSGVKMTKEQINGAKPSPKTKLLTGDKAAKAHEKHLLSEPEKKALKERTMVGYTSLPSNDPLEANCNRTAATYLQAAINREKGLPIDVYQEVKSGTKWALSGGTRRHIHNPLVNQKVTKASIGEQAFAEIQQRHPNILHQDDHSMILGKKKAEDLESQNGQDTAYERVRSLASTLSNIKSFFTSKS